MARRKEPHRYTGAEPGVNPSAFARSALDDDRSSCSITVADYDASTYQTSVQSLHSFDAWLLTDRPAFSKVRWIHTSQLSKPFLRACAQKFSFHNLAVEDCLHDGERRRAKADYYTQHLFLSLPVRTVGIKQAGPDTVAPSTKDLEAGEERSADDAAIGIAQTRTLIESMPPDLQVPIHADALSVFLFPDATIISCTRNPASSNLLLPIKDRLASKGTILRESQDASMLLESLIDLGQALKLYQEALCSLDLVDIGDTYQAHLSVLEGKILLAPNTDAVRHLYLLGAELAALKRTFAPMQTVIYGLRQYDGAKTATIARLLPPPSGESTPLQRFPSSVHVLEENGGYLSAQAKVYLSDVHDHLEELASLCEQLMSTCDSLMDYTFQMVNLAMQESMNGLSLITVIFLPATFITGFFGMNFIPFPALKHELGYFWSITIPVVFGSMVLFGWSYFVGLWRRARNFVKQKGIARKSTRKRP